LAFPALIARNTWLIIRGSSSQAAIVLIVDKGCLTIDPSILIQQDALRDTPVACFVFEDSQKCVLYVSIEMWEAHDESG